MDKTGSMRIDEDRLWDSITEMGRHGALPNGGCHRLALTREDKLGRDLFDGPGWRAGWPK